MAQTNAHRFAASLGHGIRLCHQGQGGYLTTGAEGHAAAAQIAVINAIGYGAGQYVVGAEGGGTAEGQPHASVARRPPERDPG